MSILSSVDFYKRFNQIHVIETRTETTPQQVLTDIEFLAKLEADINALRLRLAQGKG